MAAVADAVGGAGVVFACGSAENVCGDVVEGWAVGVVAAEGVVDGPVAAAAGALFGGPSGHESAPEFAMFGEVDACDGGHGVSW